jgi:hypothetical protein
MGLLSSSRRGGSTPTQAPKPPEQQPIVQKVHHTMNVMVNAGDVPVLAAQAPQVPKLPSVQLTAEFERAPHATLVLCILLYLAMLDQFGSLLWQWAALTVLIIVAAWGLHSYRLSSIMAANANPRAAKPADDIRNTWLAIVILVSLLWLAVAEKHDWWPYANAYM